jgi:C3HC4-type zinc finger (RING finger) protein
MAENASNIVKLICVKDKSKLRVRIVSPGYLPEANCQFPRDLRAEGRNFHVDAENIKLVKTAGKWFYSIKKGINIVENDAPVNLQIFEDDAVIECNICFAENKDTVFDPCGHYYTCGKCSSLVHECPICRTPIKSRILKSNMG